MISLLDGEKIVLIKKRHWFVVAVDAGYFILLAFFPFIGVFALYVVLPQVADFFQKNMALAGFYGFAWLLFLWMFFFVNWTNYYLDVFLVTNKRIVYIDQIKLFKRNTNELRLEKIQDIEVKILGIVPALLKMGNLYIQTAGSSEKVVFKNIPQVYEVKNIISQCCDNILKVSPEASLHKV